VLHGTKQYCSGARVCTHALVTASAGDEAAIRGRGGNLEPREDTWPATGMAGSDALDVGFPGIAAEPVGPPGGYTSRPGFSHGGAGLAQLAGVKSAVIVAAHPDDEVLGAGGLISMLAAARARLRLVAVTDGERSHLGHTTGLAAREDELAAVLAPLVAGFDLCLAPWDGDMHPDHEAAGRAARRANPGHLYYFPVWMWHWAPPAIPGCPGTGNCVSRCRRARRAGNARPSHASPARPKTGATASGPCSPLA
jgi:hypothetical protein